MNFVISNLNYFVSPEFFSNSFSNSNVDAKICKFVLETVSNFYPFKRAILTFEDKAYSLTEFEETISEWRNSLTD